MSFILLTGLEQFELSFGAIIIFFSFIKLFISNLCSLNWVKQRTIFWWALIRDSHKLMWGILAIWVPHTYMSIIQVYKSLARGFQLKLQISPNFTIAAFGSKHKLSVYFDNNIARSSKTFILFSFAIVSEESPATHEKSI